jgi:hypothetical protein
MGLKRAEPLESQHGVRLPAAPKPKALRTEKPPRARAIATIIAAPAPVPAFLPTVAPPRPRVVLMSGSAARVLAELERDECRYPVDDPGAGNGERMLFCGAQVDEDGDRYCADHKKVCFRAPAPPRKTKAKGPPEPNRERWAARLQGSDAA